MSSSKEQPLDLVVAEVEAESIEEQPKPRVLRFGSPEMIATKERLQMEKVGGHVGQLALELHSVPNPFEL